MGRKPKPATMHMRQATYKPGRHGVSPVAGGELIRPSDLKGDAAKLWDRVSDFAVQAGAGECDIACLDGMCRWYAEWRRCGAVLGSAIPGDEDHRTLQYVTSNAWKQFSEMASRFGLTPADRAKLRTGVEDSQSTLDRMFGNRAS